MQLDARYSNGAGAVNNVMFDYKAGYTSSMPLGPCECANRVCAVYQQAFFQLKGIFLPCNITTSGPCSSSPNVTLTLISPNFSSWLGGSVRVQICP